MSFSNLIIVFIFSIITSLSLNIFALEEKSLAEIVRDRAQNSNQAAQNNQSTAHIPGYSEKDKQEIEGRLGKIEVDMQNDKLRSEGEKCRKKEIENNPDGAIATMAEATDFKRVKGFEGYSDLKMFTEADKHMKDPIGQMSLIKGEGCVEQINNKKKGFIRKENKETVIDRIEEIKSCEAPVNNFKCNKTLEVVCKKTAECDYGGLVKGSIDSGMLFDVKNGFFTVGVDCDNCLSGTCATHERIVTFSMSQVHLITSFELVHVKFDDHIQLTLNGHVVYVGPHGGNYIEVVKRHNGFHDTEMVYNGIRDLKCELGTDWNEKVNVDLRPFLQEGKNTLHMRVIVSGSGEGWLKIKAKQQCCANDDWQETWVDHCEQTS